MSSQNNDKIIKIVLVNKIQIIIIIKINNYYLKKYKRTKENNYSETNNTINDNGAETLELLS